MPCEDPRLGRDGRGFDWTHTQDSDSFIELECVVTEVKDPLKR